MATMSEEQPIQQESPVETEAGPREALPLAFGVAFLKTVRQWVTDTIYTLKHGPSERNLVSQSQKQDMPKEPKPSDPDETWKMFQT